MQAMNIPILSSQVQELSSVSFGYSGTSEVNSFGNENEKNGSSFLEMLTSLNSTQTVQNDISTEKKKNAIIFCWLEIKY